MSDHQYPIFLPRSPAPDTTDAEREERKKATQFQPGTTPNKDGVNQHTRMVRTNSDEPSSTPPKRDAKQMHANSTAGKLAAKTGVSIHKAKQAKIAFTAAQHALVFGDAGEAARLLERWRQLAPRTNISTKETS